MAATIRLLLRRRAEAPSAPSLALLQPLFPRPYSKLSAPPVPSPSLLRRTSGEGCSALLRVPRKPTDRGGREATQRPIQAQFLLRAVNSLVEQPALVLKGIETCEKACELLGAGVDDDKVFAMFEKGLDDALIDFAVYEKVLDVLAEALGSTKGMQLDIDLESNRMMCKRRKSSLETTRQELKKFQRSHETKIILEKINKWLVFANVVRGAFILLMLLLITMGIYLA